MPHYCLTVDLVDDPEVFAEYEKYHQAVWPEVLESLVTAGVTQMEIYRFGPRMCMVLQTTDDFTFENKSQMDAANPVVQKWETHMWKYQQSIPGAKPGEKWVLMKKVFDMRQQMTRR